MYEVCAFRVLLVVTCQYCVYKYEVCAFRVLLVVARSVLRLQVWSVCVQSVVSSNTVGAAFTSMECVRSECC